MWKAIGKLSPSKVTVFITGPNGINRGSVLEKLNFGNISDTLNDYKLGMVGDAESRSEERVEVAVSWNIFGSRCPSIQIMDYRQIDAIIYVVNGGVLPDEHMKGAALGLKYLHRDFKHASLAVVVNKGSMGKGIQMTTEEVRSVLKVDKCSKHVDVFTVEETTGEGLEKIQDWLTCELGKKFTRECLFGPDDQPTKLKKRDAKPFYSRILNSFKGLFSRI